MVHPVALICFSGKDVHEVHHGMYARGNFYVYFYDGNAYLGELLLKVFLCAKLLVLVIIFAKHFNFANKKNTAAFI